MFVNRTSATFGYCIHLKVASEEGKFNLNKFSIFYKKKYVKINNNLSLFINLKYLNLNKC